MWSFHLTTLKDRALSNCTSPRLRNTKKMVHGSERISWWICATFDFCTLNNLTRKWLRNEHCQEGLLHLLKNLAESRGNCKWKKNQFQTRSKPRCLTWRQSHKTGFLKDCQLKEKEKKSHYIIQAAMDSIPQTENTASASRFQVLNDTTNRTTFPTCP